MRDFPLLPSDRYIAEQLGLSDAQYRYFMAEVRRRAAEGPQPSVVAGIDPVTLATTLLVNALLTIGFAIIASFFKPRAQEPARLNQNQVQGQVTSNNRRYTPRQGFDSVQDVAGIGTPIPLVYAKRELIGGNYYGGVRVNVPLVWSQLLTSDKGQLLRAMFVIGEGDSSFAIDPKNIAIGNNSLGSYLLGGDTYARFTVYYRANGGRIATTDRVAGASNDPTVINASDVFAIPNEAGTAAPYFCHTRKPNTQTQFGVYSLIGNGLGFRVNPQLRPSVNAQLTVDTNSAAGKKGGSASAKGKIVCDLDYVALAQREKIKARFSGRGALTAASGSTWTYRLTNTTDAQTTFQASGSAITWSGGKSLIVNPLPGIANNTVDGWLSFSSISSSGNSVTGTAVFDTTAATTAINTKSGGSFVYNITDGTYVIQWGIWWQSSSGKQIAFDHTVQVSVTDNAGTTLRDCNYTNTSVSYTGTYSANAEYEEKCGDAASAIAGRQKSYDDALQVGELFKIGTALAVCTDRSPDTEFFSSDADYEPVTPSQGQAIDVTFQVVRSGSATTISATDIAKDAKSAPPFHTATSNSHLFRIAIANFSTLRECRIVEIGIRSTLGIRISGLCNFRDSLTFTEIDGKACKDKEGNLLNPGDSIAVDVFNSGVMNSSEERFSFFRIRYREGGTDGAYTEFPQCFGIRGISQQPVFNSIRFVMPSQKRWEFQVEPLTGWEIRSGNASGDLELIDSNLTTTRTITSGGATVTFRGVNNSGPFLSAANRAANGATVFMIPSAQRGASNEIGLGYSDGTSYLDAWGKLAESFVYEEVTSTADSGPEHEIVFINEISPNAATPEYDNLALLGLTMRSGSEWQQFGQLSCYVLSGLGNTHLFPEILQDLLTNSRYGKGDQITLSQIDTASFEAASAWCSARNLFFDGAITGKSNLRQWAADVAASHLLFFGESDGKFWLKTAWPGSVASPSAVSFKGIFNAGNIKENSFSVDFFPPEDRKPIQVSVRFREERLSTNLANPGLFATEREILVREAAPNGSDTDPIESVDLSDYCTSRGHALDVAKFLIRMRRVPTHLVKFETTHEGVLASIGPGDYIRVAMDFTSYDQLRNGAVLADGTLVSTQPFADGTYSIFAWDGTSATAPGPSTLTVSDGGNRATPTGIIFTLVNAVTQVGSYQIERISPVAEGGFTIEAIHAPTNDNNIPLIAVGFDTASNWEIEE
jgi:hypothetical protein